MDRVAQVVSYALRGNLGEAPQQEAQCRPQQADDEQAQHGQAEQAQIVLADALVDDKTHELRDEQAQANRQYVDRVRAEHQAPVWALWEWEWQSA